MSQGSILARVKRVTVEDAYISVPITKELFDPNPDENGNYHLDVDAFWKSAIELSSDLSVEWKLEETIISPHDVQKPIPMDRTSFVPNGDNV